ncbi:hypothetical protein [Sphingomonas sp. T9W2]|uniref:hypothetical protein n=1 Tax=Sphingomonas sp. T9W2 TaxID=3143183 RepID=UPI0031F4ADDA
MLTILIRKSFRLRLEFAWIPRLNEPWNVPKRLSVAAAQAASSDPFGNDPEQLKPITTHGQIGQRKGRRDCGALFISTKGV